MAAFKLHHSPRAHSSSTGKSANVARSPLGIVKTYYYLTKPGIVQGNLLSVVAGYLLASELRIAPVTFFATVVGTALIIAASCVINNIIDRNIDKQMTRTQKRALVSGAVSVPAAAWYGGGLLIAGFALLITSTNWYVVGTGVIGAFSYVVLYGLAKRHTHHGTLVGTISGSMPLVAGYVAVTNRIDVAVFLLFLLMTAWQMPHFYAIALRRQDEYSAAKIPLLPIVKGERRTQVEMIVYIFIFVVSILLLTQTGTTGAIFLFVMGPLALYWLWRGVQGLSSEMTIRKWGGQMFGLSLIILLVSCVMLSIGSFLP